MDVESGDRFYELSSLLNCIDLEELLDVAIEKIPEMLVARLVSIFLINEAQTHLILKRHNHHRDITTEIAIDEKGSLVTEVLRKKRAILIHDIHSYAKENNLPITLNKRQKYTSSSCMLIPIKVRHPVKGNQIIGVLNVADKADFTVFSKEDLRAASRIGEILGASIHNTRTIAKKLGGHQKEVMSDLQAMKRAIEKKQALDISLEEAKKKVDQILPDLPKLEKYDIHCHYSPMETIGGDLYDFIEITEKDIGIIIGDVSGHGIEAALVMSMTKQLLNVYSKIHANLREVFIRANQEIYNTLKGSSFISAFFGNLDIRRHVLHYVRAGHNPTILYNPARDPQIQELDAKGMVLGTARSESFATKLEEGCVQLQTGDILLLYTDGVVEAPNAQEEEFSLQRLIDALKRHADKPAAELTAAIRQEVQDFTGTEEQADDITLLCIKVGDIGTESINISDDDTSIYESGVFIIPTNFSDSAIDTEDLYMQQGGERADSGQLASHKPKIPVDTLSRITQSSKPETPLEELAEFLKSSNYFNLSVFKDKEQPEAAREVQKMLMAAEGSEPAPESSAAGSQYSNQLLQQMQELQTRLQNMDSQMASLSALLQNRAHLEQQLQHAHQQITQLQEELTHERQREQAAAANLRNYLLTSPVKFKDKVILMIENENYDEALHYMERLLAIAIENGHLGEIKELVEQIVFLAKVLPRKLTSTTPTSS